MAWIDDQQESASSAYLKTYMHWKSGLQISFFPYINVGTFNGFVGIGSFAKLDLKHSVPYIFLNVVRNCKLIWTVPTPD